MALERPSAKLRKDLMNQAVPLSGPLAYGRSMGIMTKRIRDLASKLSWPGHKPTPPEKKQLGRWEGEGGALHPEDEDDDDTTR